MQYYNNNSSSFDNNRLINIDIISVDNHSRFTLTRNLKKVLPVMPKDTIIAYQDRYNKDLIFTVQRDGTIIDSLIIKRNHFRDINNTSNKIISENLQNNYLDTQTIKRENTLYDTNILLVDDDKDIAKTFELFLTSEGYYNIQVFTDSRKTIKHFAELKNPSYYSLAIIDIRMPGINGIQLYQILKIMNPTLKVLFVSALDAANELSSLYNIYEEDIIKKPVEQAQFIRAVNNAVLKLYEGR